MTDINFDCPHCEQNIDAPADMAGDTVDCPNCEQSIQIPAPVATDRPVRKKVVMKKRPPAVGGERSAAPQQERETPEPAIVEPQASVSEKRRLVAFLLCFLLGAVSAHRFYAGKTGSAIAQILTLGGLGIWLFVDLIMILIGKFGDKSGLPIADW
jgi:TM2 domain-containing membrane protein YozV